MWDIRLLESDIKRQTVTLDNLANSLFNHSFLILHFSLNLPLIFFFWNKGVDTENIYYKIQFYNGIILSYG